MKDKTSILDYFDVRKSKDNIKNIAAAVGTLVMLCILAVMIVQSFLPKAKNLDPPVAYESDTDQADVFSDIIADDPIMSRFESDLDTDTQIVPETDTNTILSDKEASRSESTPKPKKDTDSAKSKSSKPAAATNSQVVTTHSPSVSSKPSTVASNPTVDTSSTASVISEPQVIPVVESAERFDERGRLIADTDTLDGKKAIAVTFDDGPSQYTYSLIEELNRRGAKATFFIVGSRPEMYPETIRFMRDSGHQIGNHTYNHIRMTTYYESSWRGEINSTDAAIMSVCGENASAFRPPYGEYNAYMARTIDKTFTMWSVDTLDWKTRNAQSVKSEFLSKAHDGSIVLLHDLYKTSVDGALAAIDELQNQGYIFVTVDELLTRYGYPISNTAHFSQYPVDSVVFVQKEEPHSDEPSPDTDTTISDSDAETDIPAADTDSMITTDTDSVPDTDIAEDTESDVPNTDSDDPDDITTEEDSEIGEE